jgi:hypothetical protein
MMKVAAASTILFLLFAGGFLVMQKGGGADLDVPRRTTDSGKNKLGRSVA